MEVVSKRSVGCVDLVGGVEDWVEGVFFAEAWKRENVIGDGVFDCVCHGDGVETCDGGD